MTKVAVVAHAGKNLGGGLKELREVLAEAGFPKPAWYEISKSSAAPKYGPPGHPRRRRRAVRLGWRRHRAALCRRLGRHQGSDRDPARGNGEPAGRHTRGTDQSSARRSGLGCTERIARSIPGRSTASTSP